MADRSPGFEATYRQREGKHTEHRVRCRGVDDRMAAGAILQLLPADQAGDDCASNAVHEALLWGQQAALVQPPSNTTLWPYCTQPVVLSDAREVAYSSHLKLSRNSDLRLRCTAS